MSYQILQGDNLHLMRQFPNNHFDSVVTDAPYGLGKEPDPAQMLAAWLATGYLEVKGRGFMGHQWDAFVPQPAFWKEVFRVLKPGGHVLCFFGSRTYDWGVMAMRLAGFEIRDQIMWVYGSGFPKSLNVSKAIDKAAGAEREAVGHQQTNVGMQGGNFANGGGTGTVAITASATASATAEAKQWEGWGTALKPAHEPIALARKPLSEPTVAANVLKWGTGALHIDGCRVTGTTKLWQEPRGMGFHGGTDTGSKAQVENTAGRWPANLVHDGSAEVVAGFPQTESGAPGTRRRPHQTGSMSGRLGLTGEVETGFGDSGSAARFFYCAKASRADRNEGLLSSDTPAVATEATMRHKEDVSWAERNGNHHPTVKPTSLMRWMVRLVTPPGGVVLDPFAGSGSTGKAAILEGFAVVLLEMTESYVPIIEGRCAHAADVVARAAALHACRFRKGSQLDLFAQAS